MIAAAGCLTVCGLIASGWMRSSPGCGSEPATPAAALATDDPHTRPTRSIAFTEGCLTAGCHAEIALAKVRHPTVTAHACDTCHQADIGGHRYPLTLPQADLCVSCHTDLSGHPAAHGVIAQNNCLECHTPHASDGPGLLGRGSAQAACGSCHAAGELGAVSHRPFAAGRCEACHDAHSADPRGATVADGCRRCHNTEVEAMDEALSSHKGVPGSCTACHTPHTGDTPGLLKRPGRESCLECHADIREALADATVPHGAMLMQEQCNRCHDPHASGHSAMLRSNEAEVCMGCHAQPVTATDGRKVPAMDTAAANHARAGHDRCSGCHTVHGGVRSRLLRGAISAAPIGGYDRSNYSLCFSCHDARLAESVASTQFRDGNRNLHELHLRPGERSRGCAACHAMHADGEPRMIAKSVPFEGSGWMMPMGFVVTPDGGRCGSGCHEPLEYSRREGGAKSRIKGGAP